MATKTTLEIRQACEIVRKDRCSPDPRGIMSGDQVALDETLNIIGALLDVVDRQQDRIDGLRRDLTELRIETRGYEGLP